ncbi:hypothetical protein DN752_09825 [Echinicola strongylocentroti]|uniref:Uncharacterized protein n=1 Tax=Echinicola strongylocentroti TaxID=1795355 RepID=A0A2Z4IHI5_9BACT|nr:hypothetical protein DN752_09825 [Echinicola strongylocentroti]
MSGGGYFCKRCIFLFQIFTISTFTMMKNKNLLAAMAISLAAFSSCQEEITPPSHRPDYPGSQW